jgi:Ras-related protein Rab-1A
MSCQDYIFKIACIGNAECGKSTLVSSYKQDKFTPDNDKSDGGGGPRSINFILKSINVNDKIVKLKIWDTAANEISSCSPLQTKFVT